MFTQTCIASANTPSRDSAVRRQCERVAGSAATKRVTCRRGLLTALSIALVSIHLTACTSVTASTQNRTTHPAVYGAQVGIVNHTDKYIYSARVGDGGGGHAQAYSAGVANMCCATLPVRWQPGLKLLVRWDMPIGRTRNLKEKLVDVEPYEEPGSIYLHFFPEDRIRIVVTNWVGGAAEHPIQLQRKPHPEGERAAMEK